MTALDDLQSAKGAIQSPGLGTELIDVFDPMAISHQLEGAIRSAIALPGPPGSPTQIDSQARDCVTAAKSYEQTASDIQRVAHTQLPEVWQGPTAEIASRDIAKLGTEVSDLQHPLEQAAAALTRWAGELAIARSRDRAGVEQLTDALQMVSREGIATKIFTSSSPGRSLALDGINARIAAVQYAEQQAKEISGTLQKLAGEISKDQISPMGDDVLTNAQLAALQDQNGALLSPAEIARADARLAAMSPADQAAFERLLAGAKSTMEAGYLWKSLAAGNDIGTLKEFASAIAPHGNDPGWLTQHLSPDMTTDSYRGQSFTQGDVDDCVAASTVIADAKLNPVNMLQLSTEWVPGVVSSTGDDSAAAFENRLLNNYQGLYTDGQGADGTMNPGTSGGIGPKGETHLANEFLGADTNSRYQFQSMGSSGARADVLGQINQAVSSGKPVPIDVTNGSENHQMMIIGQSNGKLQIYNPWGHTTWVTDSQFVNGQLGSLTNSTVSSTAPPGGLPTPYGVELPN